MLRAPVIVLKFFVAFHWSTVIARFVQVYNNLDPEDRAVRMGWDALNRFITHFKVSNADALDFAFHEAIELIQLNDEINAQQRTIARLEETLEFTNDEIFDLASREEQLAAINDSTEAKADRLRVALRDTEHRHSQLQLLKQKLQNQNSDMLGGKIRFNHWLT